MIRCRIGDRQRDLEFPILAELEAAGFTDYIAYLRNFVPGRPGGMIGSWATDEPDGFTQEDVEVLLRIQTRLAVAASTAVKSTLMTNLVTTYLGRETGRHVLHGQIRRGDGQSINAAIFYADLRGSTAMADTLARQDYIEALNHLFDATGGAVTDAGGEILSFIGDSILAIFPDANGQSMQLACEKAVGAASSALERLKSLNEIRAAARLPVLKVGIALHRGEVMYGNVGTPDRLTFSVFGAAVNEVARLDQLTKTLGQSILATGEFASAGGGPWRPLGEHHLRGVGRPVEVFALAKAPATAAAEPVADKAPERAPRAASRRRA